VLTCAKTSGCRARAYSICHRLVCSPGGDIFVFVGSRWLLDCEAGKARVNMLRVVTCLKPVAGFTGGRLNADIVQEFAMGSLIFLG